MSRAPHRLALLLGCLLGATLLVPVGASALQRLEDISCTSGSSCLAVGIADGEEEPAQVASRSWDGSDWSEVEVPAPENASKSRLSGISCTSSSACVAVGDYADSEEETTLALAMRWNGSDWDTDELPKPSGALSTKLIELACTSASFCLAVGSYLDSAEVRKSLAMSWDGSEWALGTVPIPSGAGLSELAGVSCTAANDCVAVGSFVNSSEVTKTLAVAWNGSTFSINSTPEPEGAELNQLYDVSCRPSDACTAVGTYFNATGEQKTLALRRNTSKEWSIQSTPNQSGALANELTAVSCPTNSVCSAVGIAEVGFKEIPIFIVWNGTSWSAQSIDSEALGASSVRLVSVQCLATYDCKAVGAVAYGRSAVDRNLAFTSNGYYWQVSEAGEYERKWLRSDASQATRELGGVSCPEALACFAVGATTGDSGNHGAQVAAWSGEDWSVKAAPAPEGAEASELKAVSCATASSCKAVGRYTDAEGAELPLVQSFNGSAWSIQSVPLPEAAVAAELSAVDCFSSSACTAAGSYVNAEGTRLPYALAWNGSAWSLASVPAPEGAAGAWLSGISCAAATACVAVGSQADSFGHETGFSVKRQGSSWSELATPEIEGNPQVALRGVSCLTAEACLAVGGYEAEDGTRNLAIAWTAGEWEQFEAPESQGASEGLAAVSCPNVEECLAVGLRPGSSAQPPLISRLGVDESWSVEPSGVSWEPEPPAEYAAGASAISLLGIDCHSASRCATVGSASYGDFPAKNFSLSYEQGVWLTPYFPSPGGGLRGVSCPDGESCVAVGDSIEPGGDPARAWTMSDGGWESAPTASVSGAFLNDVSCTASDQCTAIGRQSAWPFKPLAERFDGEEWVTQSVPAPSGRSSSPEAISCPTESFCVAVGFSWPADGNGPTQAMIQSWDGSSWQTDTPYFKSGTVTSSLLDVSCTSAQWCVAVGTYADSAGTPKAFLQHWNGSYWTTGYPLTPPSGYGYVLLGVDCVSSVSCKAVGSSIQIETNARAPLAATWNSAAWIPQSVQMPEGASGGALRSVDCYSATRCAAVGVTSDLAHENPYIVGWQGSEWKLEPAPQIGASPNTTLESLSCFSAADCTAVGIAQFADGPREMLVVQTEGEDPESDDPVAVAGGAVPKLNDEQKEAAMEILAEDPTLQAAIGAAEYEPKVGIWTEFDEEVEEVTVVGAFVELALEEPESWEERTWPVTEYQVGPNGYEGGAFAEQAIDASATDIETLQVSLDLTFDEEGMPIEGEVVEVSPLPRGAGEVEISPESLGAYDPIGAGY